MEELIPKKVRFREDEVLANSELPLEAMVDPKVSWKYKLVGPSNLMTKTSEDEDDIEILEEDI